MSKRDQNQAAPVNDCYGVGAIVVSVVVFGRFDCGFDFDPDFDPDFDHDPDPEPDTDFD